MLISLSNGVRPLAVCSDHPFVARVSENSKLGDDEKRVTALLLRSPDATSEILPEGYRAYLFQYESTEKLRDSYVLPTTLHYLQEGDVIRVDPIRRRVRALYRRASTANFFLVTERCDNFCLMCSQPPRQQNDDWLVDELLRVIPLVDKTTTSLGITGGEPGLLGPRLIELVRAIRDALPRTALHILSNGRAFSDLPFARDLSAIRHGDLMVGIPLYSDLAEEHDYIVQAAGAFDQTVRGILNLKSEGVRVEVRVVIHGDTVERLPELAAFLARNLTFVDHVALMGLELTGFAKTNLNELWVDPVDYVTQLEEAVRTLRHARVPMSIYNHQLCVLPSALRGFARKSISDWKNTYAPECSECDVRDECGGMFASSSIRKSRGISPLREGAPQ